MIKKLRVKFITAIMFLVAVMLLLVFLLVWNATYMDMQENNLWGLRSLERNMSCSGSGQPHTYQNERRLNSCLVVTQQPDGTLTVDTTWQDHPYDPYLPALMAQAQTSGEKTGLLREYDLRFYRMDSCQQVCYAFWDVTPDLDNLQKLIFNCALTGIVTLLLFFPVAWGLAKVITKPVENAMQKQRQFVADASHELKTPLTVILTNTALLQEQQESPEQQRYVDAIQTTGLRMRQLVEDLLELAKLEQERSASMKNKVCLSELVEECCMLFEPVYFEAGRELVSQIEPDITLPADPGKLQQLVDILLDNGCKYSDPATQVQLRLHRQGSRHCLLQISSRGITLTSKQCQDIFKRFYRLDSARTGSGSYGLGLPIAQQIVLAHGGKIHCHSKDGVTTFYVQLPL